MLDELRHHIDLDQTLPESGHLSVDGLRQLDREVRKAVRQRSWRMVLFLQSLPPDVGQRAVWKALALPVLIPEDRIFLEQIGFGSRTS